MVFLEDVLEQEEEDPVEPFEEDVRGVVDWLGSLHPRGQLASTSLQKPPLLYFQPGDGRFSEIELELYKVLRKEETEGEHVHLCEPKPKDKSPGILEPAVGELELLECCDKQELDENLTSSF